MGQRAPNLLRRMAGMLVLTWCIIMLDGARAEEMRGFTVPNEEDLVLWNGFSIPSSSLEGEVADRNVEEDERIIAGNTPDRIAEFPYMAAVGTRTSEGSIRFLCSAIIVGKRIVMTAAHCIYPPKHGQYVVCAQTMNLMSKTRECFDVVDYRIPKGFKEYLADRHTNFLVKDIALMKTNSTIEYQHRSKAIKVSFEPMEVSHGLILGYGHRNTAATLSDMRLRYADVMFSPFEDCFELRTVRTKQFLCVNGNFDGTGGGPCQGDSGGPLISFTSEDPDTHILRGVMSFAFTLEGRPGTCNPEAPSGYVELSNFFVRRWLRHSIYSLGGVFRRADSY